MPFTWTDAAKAELRKIDRERAPEILETLAKYEKTGHGDVRLLKGSADWRLQVGDYRVRFQVMPDRMLQIVHVKHRSEAYR